MGKKFELKEVKKITKSISEYWELKSTKYVNSITKMDFYCKKHDNNFKQDLTHLKRGQGCLDCSKEKYVHPMKLSIEECNKRLKEKYPNVKIISGKYTSTSTSDLIFRCSDCGYEWTTSWNSVYFNDHSNDCPNCNGKILNNSNNFIAVNPHLADYIENKEIGYNTFAYSSKEIDLKCPYCGRIETRQISTVSTRGHSCKYCGVRGNSMPQTFVSEILSSLGIKYLEDRTTCWSENKRYDFIINDLNMIIEVHGEQHYISKKSLDWDDLEHQISNDAYKKELALKNGIKHYIEINARYATFKHIVKSFKESLRDYFEVDTIDYGTAFKNITNSSIKKTWDLYLEGKTRKEISNILNKVNSTVHNYLKLGFDCGYIKELRGDAGKRVSKTCNKTGEKTIFYSIIEMSKDLGLDVTTVSRILRGIYDQREEYTLRYE